MTVYLSMVISLFWCFAVFFSILSFFLLHTHTHAHGRKGQPMILLFLYYRRCHRKYDERIHRSCWIIITQWWKRISTKSTLILRWHWTTRKKSYLKITSELWTTNDRVWFMFCTKSNDNHFFFSILPLFVVVVGFIITINVCFFMWQEIATSGSFAVYWIGRYCAWQWTSWATIPWCSSRPLQRRRTQHWRAIILISHQQHH